MQSVVPADVIDPKLGAVRRLLSKYLRERSSIHARPLHTRKLHSISSAPARHGSIMAWIGSYNTVYADNDVLIYKRQDGNNLVLVAVNRGGAKDITLHNNLGFAPGTYRGVIADASPANGQNYVRVDRHSAVIHLEAISSTVFA